MKIIFLGTKGYIEEESPHHKQHTSTLICYKKSNILIDCGISWLNQLKLLKKYKPQALLLTHAHPDHAAGLQNGTFAPIYASRKTLQLIKNFPIEQHKLHVLSANKAVKLFDFIITRYNIEHSIRCPGSSYRIQAGKTTIFYSGDIIYLPHYQRRLANVDLYIGDAASTTRTLIRRKNNKIFGHASIATQLGWCQKAAVEKAIFTHCGKELTEKPYKQANSIVEKLGREKNIQAKLAYDSMKIIV